MRIAIMQPYFFPYIGYFQLVNAVDKFVFYDDVNYIKRGWINRNKVLINNVPTYITIPLEKVSQNKLINEVKILKNGKWKAKLNKSVTMAYSKAPFFEEVFPIFENLIMSEVDFISDLSMLSVKVIAKYLGIDVEFKISSEDFPHTMNLDRADRLIHITKEEEGSTYINLIGGKDIYNKEYFSKYGIQLQFLRGELVPYEQRSKEFIPGLSIIDVIMNNSVDKVKEMVKGGRLV